MNTLSLTPLFRQSVGFDRFMDMFDSAMRSEEAGSAYPPYNIEKLGEDRYRVTMAVAGFQEPDLTITAQANQLIVAGKINDKQEEGVTYLHKGIATRSFERKFSLADHVKVAEAELADGMLRITLEREIPEAFKPRIISIKNEKGSKKLENKTR